MTCSQVQWLRQCLRIKPFGFDQLIISISKKSNVLSILPNCKSSHNFEGVSPPAYLLNKQQEVMRQLILQQELIYLI